jgi:hypothetical protein
MSLYRYLRGCNPDLPSLDLNFPPSSPIPEPPSHNRKFVLEQDRTYCGVYLMPSSETRTTRGEGTVPIAVDFVLICGKRKRLSGFVLNLEVLYTARKCGSHEILSSRNRANSHNCHKTLAWEVT